MLNEREAEADQPILVGQNEHPGLTRDDPIHQSKQLLALNAETAANCFDPCIDDQSPSVQNCSRVGRGSHEIGLLCST